MMMKRTLAAILAFLLSAALFAQIPTVERWGCHEIELKARTASNPFDVKLSARFTLGDRTITVSGFYDGDDTWRIRFMPPCEGQWRYVTSSSLPALRSKKGAVECVAPQEGNHGPVCAEGTRFVYADGTPYNPVGTTSYDWMHVPGDRPQRTLKSLSESGFNKIRMLFFLHNLDIEYPEIYPFLKNADGSWDYEHFDPRYFRYVEQRILGLQELGIEADLILFHPYDGGRWGFDRMPLEVNLRYLEYISARLGAYRNVWWSLANEWDGVKGIPAEDWYKFAKCLSKADPFDHLLSIHGYTATYFEYWLPEFTHVSVQDHAPVMSQGPAFTIRNIYKKPVIFDEVCYEGNVGSRWGWLSGEEELRRMYNGLMCGTYVTHAECLNLNSGIIGEDETNYLAFGGEFHGESWKRIRFMRSIIDALPGQLGLADSSWDSLTSSAGEGCYLIYFGDSMPQEWAFDLPVKNGKYPKLGEGVRFKVEILDTWNMTVTEEPGEFVTAKPGRYRVSDRDGRVVRLPKRPYLMLRITAINQ